MPTPSDQFFGPTRVFFHEQFRTALAHSLKFYCWDWMVQFHVISLHSVMI